MAKILVTGGAGFIGDHVVKELIKKSHEVFIFDLKEGDCKEAKYFITNLKNKELLKENLTKIKPDMIIHLAGLIKGKYKDLYEVNILGTKNILNLFSGRCIFLSTGMVYQGNNSPYEENMNTNPKDEYARTKLAAEELCLERKNNTVIRASIVYGPNQKGDMFLPSLKEAIRKKEVFKMTKGEQKRDFIHVKDLTNAICILMEKEESGIFNISSGENISLQEVIHQAKAIVGYFPIEQNIPYRENETWGYKLKNEKAKNILQWSPKISLKEGLKEMLENKVF